MDIRLTTVCNNNCLYCLENSIRNKNISLYDSFKTVPDSICVYWGNIFVDSKFKEKLLFFKERGCEIDAIQTNWYNLKENLSFLKSIWIKTINLKLHSFVNDKIEHALSGNLLSLNFREKLNLITLILKAGFDLNIAYHVTFLSLRYILLDIKLLDKFSIWSIDFIWPIPFGKAWINKKKVLINFRNKEIIHIVEPLFIYLSNKNRKFNFLKFPRRFFGKYGYFYNFKKTILQQISLEDKQRINWKAIPNCYPYRCDYCFLQDICRFYDRKNIS